MTQMSGNARVDRVKDKNASSRESGMSSEEQSDIDDKEKGQPSTR
jgi:hypothetical protein